MRRISSWLDLSASPLFACALVTGLAACSSSPSNSNGNNNGAVDCTSAAVPKFSELFAFEKCTSCHSTSLTGTSRLDAPTSVNYDSYPSAKSLAEDAIAAIQSNSMPPEGSEDLTAAEIEAIIRWASCGTPE